MTEKATLGLPFQKHPFDTQGKVLVNKEWYLALLGLVTQQNSSGSSASVDEVTLLEAIDAFVGPESGQYSLVDLNAQLQALIPEDATERLIQIVRQLEIQIALIPDLQDMQHGGPISSVTVGASPFTYTARTDGSVYVIGGTVSTIVFGRSGTTFTTGQTAGSFLLNANDTLAVTYSVAPTMEFVPR